jgi:hypothetical protein
LNRSLNTSTIIVEMNRTKILGSITGVYSIDFYRIII